jgi:hypothetical protein
MPVEVRDASAVSAMFLVRADVARALIAYSGLDVAEPLRGQAVCSLAFIRYVDGDLGPYNEFAVSFLVRPQGSHRRGRMGAFIHRLPVDGSLAPGRCSGPPRREPDCRGAGRTRAAQTRRHDQQRSALADELRRCRGGFLVIGFTAAAAAGRPR